MSTYFGLKALLNRPEELRFNVFDMYSIGFISGSSLLAWDSPSQHPSRSVVASSVNLTERFELVSSSDVTLFSSD